jgi:hypothetical protein
LTVDHSETARWLDRFFDFYYRCHPVNATFIGVHDHDHRLPDYSESGAGETLAAARRLLAEAPVAGPLADDSTTAADRAGFADHQVDAIDLRLARGFLEILAWELESSHFHRGNPCLYTGEAVFGTMSLFLTPFAPLSERIAAATERLEATPQLLAQGIANVRRSPRQWTERAIRECRGATAFLTEGIDRLLATERTTSPALTTAAARAAAGFNRFQDYLETELRTKPTDQVGCGEAALNRYLVDGHCLAESAEEIARYAEGELVAAGAALAGRPRCQPTEPVRGIERYQELWNEVRRTAGDHRLLTWPDCPIRYRERPEWTRRAAPDLYFLHYRSPAALNAAPVHEYLVPDEPQSEASIKLNHVIHHGSIGHHLQNWHAARARSRIGRIAAVDCASRIAMSGGGTMAEGWACYATDLMDEIGFLTEAERTDELRTRCRMCARAVVDVRLHQGRLTLEEAARYYQEQAGMPAEAAAGEATRNSMFPGTALMYLMGRDAIHRLRGNLATRSGPRFGLMSFHDQLLSFGSIPVALIAEEMEQGTRGVAD